MHESGAQIHPRVKPDEIEWLFEPGEPAIVVHVPTGSGTWEAWRLDHTAPDAPAARAFAQTMLVLAQQTLDRTEPAVSNEVSA